MKTRLRELAPAARGSQDAGSRNLVFTFQLSTVIDVACVCGQSRTIWGRGWATGREGGGEGGVCDATEATDGGHGFAIYTAQFSALASHYVNHGAVG